MLKFVNLIIIAILLSSCCVFRKVKTKTVTETIIKVDTVIQVRKDTITLVKTVTLHDTAFLENEVAKAKSYYDSTTHKITLQLTGKPFGVPFTYYKRTIAKEIVKEKIPEQKSLIVFALFLMGFTLLVLLSIKNNY
jgi:hypothetical protein